MRTLFKTKVADYDHKHWMEVKYLSWASKSKNLDMEGFEPVRFYVVLFSPLICYILTTFIKS